MFTSIERIESVGPDARARRIFFADGSPARVTSAAAVRLLGLEVGREVEPDQVLGALATNEPQLARDRALQLLGYRERSSQELTQRLHRDGYPDGIVDEVVSRFCEVELVDDRRFASAWIRSRVSAGYGLRRIKRELREKGVADDVVEDAVVESELEDELLRARAALRGRAPRDSKEREKLVRRLVGRGFDLRVAVDAVGPVPPADSSDT